MVRLNYCYACASGIFGACVSILESGNISLPPRSDMSLNVDQAKVRSYTGTPSTAAVKYNNHLVRTRATLIEWRPDGKTTVSLR